MDRPLPKIALYLAALALAFPSSANAARRLTAGGTCSLGCMQDIQCFDSTGDPQFFEDFVLLRSAGGDFTQVDQEGPRILTSNEAGTRSGTKLLFQMCITGSPGGLRACTSTIPMTYVNQICPPTPGGGTGITPPSPCNVHPLPPECRIK